MRTARVGKPIANTLPKADRIVQTVDEVGYQVLVGRQRRHNPPVRGARTIEQGSAPGHLIEISMMWAVLKPTDHYRIG